MTPAEEVELSGLVKSILVGSYDHRDLKLLLVALRRFVPGGTLVRELGDFMAHPERDRGLLHRRVFCYYDQLSKAVRDGSSTLCVEPPLKAEDTVTGLSRALLELFPSHRPYIERLGEQAGGLQLCLLCLLQGATFARDEINVSCQVPAVSERV